MAWSQGNKFGRLGAPVTDAIRRAALAGDSKRLREAADRLLDSAAYGESWQERIQAFTFIADRLEGKATTRLEVNGEGTRELSLSDVVAAVLAARRTDATEAHVIDSAGDSVPALPGDPTPTPLSSEAGGG